MNLFYGNIDGFDTSRAFYNFKLDFNSLVESFILLVGFDIAVVHEHILAIVLLNETEAFLAVKPLHFAIRH